MDDAGLVEVVDAAEHLVEKEAHPLVVELHVDDLTEVGVHELHAQVHVVELAEGLLRRVRVEQLDNLEKGKVTQCSASMK